MKTDLLYRRDIVTELEKYLRTDDIVVLHGARQVGKTSILRYIEDGLKHKGEKTRYIDLEDSRYVKILDAGVDGLLGLLTEDGLYAPGQKPEKRVFVFIDEIQYLQNPSSFLKLVRDHHSGLKLLVSGSSSFAIKSKFRDSLVGRTVEFDVLPLSFREFLLFRNYSFEQSRVITEKKKDELKTLFREYALYGGYPRIVLTLEPDKKEKYLQQIVDTYVKKDIRDLGNVRDISKFNRLLEALASQSGNLLNVNELSGTTGIARQTVEHYLFIMENTYVIRLVRPYSRNIRMELFKLPKIFFYDTGLMQMLFGWASTVSLRIKADPAKLAACTDCKGCERVCFMNVKPRLPRKDINCVNCGECIEACNKELGRGRGVFSFSNSGLNTLPHRESSDASGEALINLKKASGGKCYENTCHRL